MSRLFILYIVIVLQTSKQALAAFSNPREMVFGVHSIRVFSNFCWIPIMNHHRGSRYTVAMLSASQGCVT